MEHLITNDTKTITHEFIAIVPHVNIQSIQKVFDIRSSFIDKCPGFIGFYRKLARTKNQQSMGVEYFPGFWSCLCAHEQKWRQLRLIVFIIVSLCFTFS